MINTIYLAALKAAGAMARHLGEEDAARLYETKAANAAGRLDGLTFNGEYYVQRIGDVNQVKYQYGAGCLSDQLFGQQLAHLNGLGHLLDPAKVQSAIQAVYRHNFKRDISDHNGVQRTYALNEEAGLLLCTWPDGGRPRIPFVYSDEVWTGIEYQVAAHLIYEGYPKEGLDIVKAVRARHDGIKRSPWNEVECGHHYARSMASYGLLLAMTGLQVDLPAGTVTFGPVPNPETFRAFASWGTGWGVLSVTEEGEAHCEVLYGTQEGIKVQYRG
jgi:uncharacterized protein (DUF608 family)